MKLGFLIEALRDQIISVRYAGRQISGATLHQLSCRAPFDSSIRGISLHSKRTKKDYVFFCLSGTLFEGRDFITEAWKNGATAVVIDKRLTHKIPKNVTIIRVKDCSVSLGFAANAFHGFPLEKINLTAITGTNGKTTVAFLLENILGACNMPSGVIGTVHYRFGKRLFRAHNTTPDIVKTFEFLNQMVRAKSRFLFMEVSSNALAQHRIR